VTASSCTSSAGLVVTVPSERDRATEVLARKQRLEDLVAMGLADYAKWDVVIDREHSTGSRLTESHLDSLGLDTVLLEQCERARLRG